ncbi:MAG: hypothetical protein JOZ72_12485 [Alphaproteobacteria bacterium]|nr:hypothetical protein [Alphaproteobacteria bacterium]
MKTPIYVVTLSLLAPPALAADLKGEIVNATEHAEYAAAAPTIAEAHAHLHHALNCIVGPGGNGFDSKEMNPCAGSGSGIIPDESDAAARTALEGAAAEARDGLASDDLAKAKADAGAVAGALKGLK